MCDHAAPSALNLFTRFTQPHLLAAPGAGAWSPSPAAMPLASPPSTGSGSRRRRLWDLPHSCHCPVVGVCLPLDTLRRLVNKALGGKALSDDYEVHVGAVAECVQRNRLSELLQTELDQRYAQVIKTWRAAKTAHAVADLWAAAVRRGDVAGAFWAGLTHPCCDAALQEVLCRDMHMLQHQAGAVVRVDTARLNSLLEENAALAKNLLKVQERNTRQLADKAAEIERLHQQLMQARADSLAKDSQIAFLSDDLATLKAAIPGFDSAERLLRKLEQLQARLTEVEAHNTELRHKLASATRALDASTAAQASRCASPEAPTQPASPITLHLNHKTVLCVGGRSGSVTSYREVVERIGGRFAYHDGGLEDNANVLDASLAAADVVVCQTGCISHNAYWKVKDFCKRTGKRCLFVENPSASSLVRSLAIHVQPDTDAAPAEHSPQQPPSVPSTRQ